MECNEAPPHRMSASTMGPVRMRRVLETKDPEPLIPRRMFRGREHSSSRGSAVSYGTCEYVGEHVWLHVLDYLE